MILGLIFIDLKQTVHDSLKAIDLTDSMDDMYRLDDSI